jgi:hypothetical protein
MKRSGRRNEETLKMSDESWRAVAEELEGEARSIQGERMRALELKGKVEKALTLAESADSSADLQTTSRLDHLLIVLTDATKENICTNTKCPHYSKKCKMR